MALIEQRVRQSKPGWRVVNADLVPMWQWLGTNPIVADLAPAREVLPDIADMETWLRRR